MARLGASGQGVLLALGAALLFGLVNVAAKATTLDPLLKSGLAYLIAGLLLAPTLRGLRLARRDWPTVLLMALVGGALAPIALFYGLTQARALDASLLLTLEILFTALLAFLFLGERLRRRGLAGLALLFLAALLLAFATQQDEGARSTLWGLLLVALAALGWGLDNTLSARLVGGYRPHHVLALKGLLGGGATLAVALLLGARPIFTLQDAGLVLFLGVFSIGGSVLLFYHALSRIGATRTASLFLPASALTGALAGWLLLGESFGPLHLLAAVLVLAGVVSVVGRSA